jgi:lysozyme
MARMMRTSGRGLSAIKHFEGCVLTTYQCPAGIDTIGYGHTGFDVVPGLVWTQEQAEETLMRDLERYERAVESAITRPMTQGQFDACVSLCFNIGPHAFAKSTLVQRFNQGDIAGAGRQFTVWNRAAGKFNAALLERRTAELWMFATSTKQLDF